MNVDILEGEWTKLKGEAKAKWGELTDDDLKTVSGDVEALIGAVQAKYGYKRADAKAEVDDWLAKVRG